ncbi:hypothetical protein SLA2020_122440 [Shorea laevis]
MSLSNLILVAPRDGIRRLANFCWEGFHASSGSHGSNSSFRLLCSKSSGLERGYSRRWTRRPMSTKTEGRNKTNLSSKPGSIVHEILDGKLSQSAALNVNKAGIIETQKTQYCDIQQKIVENKDLASLVTTIVFDIETTGLSREEERIIEIALQDLAGGENSTFQTLVNPGRYVPNPHVHGITTHMVCRPNVPRMEELIPILLQYVNSRQKPGGYVMLVAHNGRCFDVPFLISEFSRCSYEIPPNWLFVDTLSLARELKKSGVSRLPSKTSLQALREYYNIPLVGSAHRAMSDVRSLSMVLQRLTFDLKLSIPCLVGKSFTALDCINSKKKKKNSG